MTLGEAFRRLQSWDTEARGILPVPCSGKRQLIGAPLTHRFGFDFFPHMTLTMLSLVHAIHDAQTDDDLRAGVRCYLELCRRDAFTNEVFSAETHRLLRVMGIDAMEQN